MYNLNSKITSILNKIIGSNLIFAIIIVSFVLGLAFITCNRRGRDLKVGLFGVKQVLQKKSPYENPTDPNRPLFRYAPGFAILQYPFMLKAKMIAPFQFKDITPSVLVWYFVKILFLFIMAWLLLKIIPARSKEISLRNLKISFLLALPLIGYELSNGQNKLVALFFMLLAIFLFEQSMLLPSAMFYCLALTVYLPLSFFIIYFILKRKMSFVISFAIAVLIVFVVFPSLVFGIGFNNYLLQEWFMRTIKPFSFTKSYVTYIDLRDSSQSLPSAIGRIFVSQQFRNFQYHISPIYIHFIIRIFSAIIIFASCMAVWKRLKLNTKGLDYSIFLILALILPQYCIFYTWSWVFVLYFAIFNYISFLEVATWEKRFLFSLFVISYTSICLIGFHAFNHLSLIFWATLVLWLGMVVFLLRKSFLEHKTR